MGIHTTRAERLEKADFPGSSGEGPFIGRDSASALWSSLASPTLSSPRLGKGAAPPSRAQDRQEEKPGRERSSCRDGIIRRMLCCGEGNLLSYRTEQCRVSQEWELRIRNGKERQERKAGERQSQPQPAGLPTGATFACHLFYWLFLFAGWFLSPSIGQPGWAFRKQPVSSHFLFPLWAPTVEVPGSQQLQPRSRFLSEHHCAFKKTLFESSRAEQQRAAPTCIPAGCLWQTCLHRSPPMADALP